MLQQQYLSEVSSLTIVIHLIEEQERQMPFVLLTEELVLQGI